MKISMRAILFVSLLMFMTTAETDDDMGMITARSQDDGAPRADYDEYMGDGIPEELTRRIVEEFQRQCGNITPPQRPDMRQQQRYFNRIQVCTVDVLRSLHDGKSRAIDLYLNTLKRKIQANNGLGGSPAELTAEVFRVLKDEGYSTWAFQKEWSEHFFIPLLDRYGIPQERFKIPLTKSINEFSAIKTDFRDEDIVKFLDELIDLLQKKRNEGLTYLTHDEFYRMVEEKASEYDVGELDLSEIFTPQAMPLSQEGGAPQQAQGTDSAQAQRRANYRKGGTAADEAWKIEVDNRKKSGSSDIFTAFAIIAGVLSVMA